MPIPSEYAEVCDLLLEATKERRVNWLPGGFSTVRVQLPEYSFEIWGGSDAQDEVGFVAVGLRESGARTLFDNFHLEEGDPDYRKLHDLWTNAQRQVRRVDEKLGVLRDLLKRDSEVGLFDSKPDEQ